MKGKSQKLKYARLIILIVAVLTFIVLRWGLDGDNQDKASCQEPIANTTQVE